MENSSINAVKLELLAPAKSSDFAIAAIDSGADAVYIGGPRFGARSAASNSLEDIERVVSYAHKFDARVYVVINTIIYEDELREVEALVLELYNIGVDALIVQDMAFAKLSIPPIPLFASTQTTNYSLEKIQFLEKVGFERVILERALSLSQIREICSSTSVDIEAFVHGAICVSYSGNCYLSHRVAGRSANRGVCAQPCRSTYDLMDEDDNVIIRDKHLLSVKDLSLDGSLSELVEAGVTSFKVEGRLKDIVYLKNITAHYNKLLNEIVEKSGGKYERASKGVTTKKFEPNPDKSFSRTLTSYMISGRKGAMATFDTAKSLGEYIGKVTAVSGNSFTVDNKNHGVSNGDGICFISPTGDFSGTNVNSVVGCRIITPKQMIIAKGSRTYRNLDRKFSALLTSENDKRKVPITIYMNISRAKVVLKAVAPQSAVLLEMPNSFDLAKNEIMALENIKSQLTKGGDTIFLVNEVVVDGIAPFVPTKVINGLRRELLEKLENQMSEDYCRRDAVQKLVAAPYFLKSLDYKGNVSNSLSEQFYRECGVESIEQCAELSGNFRGVELMKMSYCIRKEIGECLKDGGKYKKLYLINGSRRFLVKFDCAKCQSYLVEE